MKRVLTAEALGSCLLFAAVIGSGIMAEKLASGNVGIALLANSVATGAMLFVLITMLSPVSGAHFNPAVSLAMRLRGDGSWRTMGLRCGVQIGGGIAGTVAAHAMFGLQILQLSTRQRSGPDLLFSEGLATFGLVLTIFGTTRRRPSAVPASVALYIMAAYWFTASTSFANPAITIARSLTDTFAGIAPANVPGFIVAQLIGAVAAERLCRWLFAAD